jgi:hypothetical protein
MSETFATSGGVQQLPVGDLNTTFGYDGSGNMTTMTVVYRGVTYIKTLTYNGSGKCTNISEWVAQP